MTTIDPSYKKHLDKVDRVQAKEDLRRSAPDAAVYVEPEVKPITEEQAAYILERRLAAQAVIQKARKK